MGAKWLESTISALSPAWALSRDRSRRILAAYDAAQSTRLRKDRLESGSGSAAINRAGGRLRWKARDLDENNDLASGILDLLVNRSIGPAGIQIEPLPMTTDGKIDVGFASQITKAYDAWSRTPEVTGKYDRAQIERLAARALYRDGEVFAHIIEGNTNTLRHGSSVPFSLEMLEADFCPDENNWPFYSTQSNDDAVYQGIELNGWGKPVAYHFYHSHPGGDRVKDFEQKTRRVPARYVLHILNEKRFNQGRGVSSFAASLNRINDLQEYETSIRIREKIGASIGAVIKRGAPDMYDPDAPISTPQNISMQAGQVIKDLLPGESFEIPDIRQSGTNTEEVRNGQVRMICSGVGTHFSGTARDHRLTYTGARTEINEAQPHYAALTVNFVSQFTRPVYERVINAAILAGEIVLSADTDVSTVFNALYLGPVMPGPDPAKEFKAHEGRVRAGFKSPQETIRELGGNPASIMEQIERWNNGAEERDLIFTSNPAHDLPNVQDDQSNQTDKILEAVENG